MDKALSRSSSTAVYAPDSDNDPMASQKGQVRFVLEACFNYARRGLKRGGYFVDLAAGHPIKLSNTYFLEKHLDWVGILIEPNPDFAEPLQTLRTSPVVKSVISTSGDGVVPFRVDNLEYGGIVGDEYDNSWAVRGDELTQAVVVDLPTERLEVVLDRLGAPREMDYLSLDIEGAEEDALSGFDFDRYRWRCATVERPSLELNLLLDRAGYIQVDHQSYDTFYIHKDFLSEADLTGLTPRFLATPRKDW